MNDETRTIVENIRDLAADGKNSVVPIIPALEWLARALIELDDARKGKR
jgi:hypothetical protein